jgi:hypothetical protein
MNAAAVAAKASANAAAAAARKAAPTTPPADAPKLAPLGGAVGPKGSSALAPLAPVVFKGFNIPGLTATATSQLSPPDTTGAIGVTRYTQIVNALAGIFNRTTGAIIGSGTLNQLANISPAVSRAGSDQGGSYPQAAK